MNDNGQGLKLPVLPSFESDTKLEVEDLSTLVPDISQAVNPPTSIQVQNPCPTCGDPECPHWLMQQSRFKGW